MAIHAECEQCGFRYAAPDKLAGKKVRCKRCGKVFALPAPAAVGGSGEEWGGSLHGIEETANQLSAAGTGAGTRPPPGATGPDESIDSVLSGAHSAQGMSAAEAIRNSLPFDFPYSRHVDRFMPPALLGLSLLIVLLQTFGSDDLPALDRPWVAFVRAVIVLALYAAVVWPLSHLGVKQGVQAQRAHMPWSPGWKSFAVFTFPYALAYTLWLVGGNIPSLLVGAIAGLLVGLAALWLLYRVRLDRGVQPLVYPAITFLIGLLIAGGFVFGINHSLNAILLGAHRAHAFASSPILPGLAWDNTPPPAVEEPPAQESRPKTALVGTDAPRAVDPPAPGAMAGPDKPVAQTPGALDPAAATPPGLTPPGSLPSGSPAPGEAPAPAARPQVTAPGGAPPAPGSPAPASPASPASPDASAVAMGPAPGLLQGVPPLPRVVKPESSEPPTSDLRPDTPLIEPSPFVREVKATPVEAGFDRVVYPLTGGEHVLVIRTRAEDRIVERWHVPTWKRTGQRRARPEPAATEPFALAADGSVLATIESWPTLSVQLWSFAENRVTLVIELDRQNGVPSLVGFVSPTQLMVHWQRDGVHGLELFDLRSPRPTRVELPGVDTIERNFVLSPDGRTFAIAGRTPQGPAVGLYTVGAQRASRQLPIKLLDAQWGVKPSGLAFSPDGSMLSAMFEQQGNALICTWRIPFGKEVPPLLYPAGALSDAPPAATGDLFGWIPGSAAWLVHGADIVDIASGRVIGQTGLRAAASQHLCPAGDVQIVQTDPAGQTRLMQVMLDAGRLPAFKP